ncbi:unnamed protein product [Urochloa humidicola]
METVLASAGGAAAAAAAGGLVAAAALAGRIATQKQQDRVNAPPAVPGLPIIGNLHQLKEKKPYQTFSRWAEDYGPIYTIRTGASSMVVLNSTEIAKEAMVAKFPSINTWKLPTALTVLTRDKKMVATSDHGEFHNKAKRYLMMSMLGASSQKQLRSVRDMTIDSMMSALHKLVADDPKAPLNFREVFKDGLFSLSLIQALGEDVSSVYVEEFGKVISKEEIYQYTVSDLMNCGLEIDWRDFFPYLRWIPNESFEKKVFTTEARRTAVARALINTQKERIERGEARLSYLDFLAAQDTLTDEQVTMLVWEAIVEAADTTLVTAEWAMYELSKSPEKQARLYQEIQEVCGNETVTEDDLPRLPYLNAVLHETLRLHPSISLSLPRFVGEDITLGGYDVPAGTELMVNIYGCNMNKNDWDEPEEWKPERFLDGKFDPRDMNKTMSFGAGRRSCPGASQATSLTCTAIGRFVQDFGWRLKEGDESISDDTIQLTTNRLHPLEVYLTPRGRK